MFAMLILLLLSSQIGLFLLLRKGHPKGDRDNLPYIFGLAIVKRLKDSHRLILLSSEEKLKLSKLYGPRSNKVETEKYVCEKLGLVYLILAAGCFFALIAGRDYVSEQTIAGRL